MLNCKLVARLGSNTWIIASCWRRKVVEDLEKLGPSLEEGVIRAEVHCCLMGSSFFVVPNHSRQNSQDDGSNIIVVILGMSAGWVLDDPRDATLKRVCSGALFCPWMNGSPSMC
jgi:hypothetical protein